MITSVSIAAQISTFPLGLLYYYQFPVYFLVSNLFVIPASTLIMWFGLLLFATSWIPVAGSLAGFLLDNTLSFMNWMVKYIDSLPFALLQGISISVPESWFIYAIVFSLVVFLHFHRGAYLLASLGMLSLLLAWNIAEKYRHLQQRRMIVYAVPKATAVDFISGTDHIFAADSSLLSDYDRMLFHIKHNWWKSGLRTAVASVSSDFKKSFAEKQRHYIQFLNQRIVLIDPDFRPPGSGTKLKTDFIIITQDAAVSMDELAACFDFRQVVFDGSNSAKKVKRWKKGCARLGIRCHDVLAEGAFIEDF
jgi:competence protein ComEC